MREITACKDWRELVHCGWGGHGTLSIPVRTIMPPMNLKAHSLA
ncbi:hypothetical protein PAMC26510_33645 [Caballeronia sordidicola]|uniref:Uncharacterized protein n=1 Tax=Caballeronia sordidicola TaxID=196367 RepID=A0A242M7H0_CABSO|nr:hypothetical protein PAMC26510_33645 [Caballeronia sordidicola]